ncbi:MAG: HAD family phosphatase [Thomasclavelia sp.]|nr:HAD family phosphatase [Thomasclavelia sp.]
MIKTIIFDLDGLLIDSEEMCYQVYVDLLAKYDKVMDLKDYAMHYSGQTATGNMTQLIKEFDLPITMEEGLTFQKGKSKEYISKGIDLKPGANELLDYLKKNNYEIMLASSSNKERALTILTNNNVVSYFDFFTYGTEVKHGKPSPDIFIKAASKSKNSKDECLVLEDSENGSRAAYDAGLKVICIPDMKEPSNKEMITKILPSLKDVIKYLEDEKKM